MDKIFLQIKITTMSNLVIESLLAKRDQLLTEKSAAIQMFDSQISEIETAVEKLYGKQCWDLTTNELFDDLSPNYIKGSQEEM